MEQQRLIGVITYIDYDKGFGFLSTNGYGIDTDGLNDKIQLYFKISSLENPEYIFEGDWVTFILQKNNNPKHKRDSAISIRLINFDKTDYLLSLQYRGIYANIFVRLASSMQSFNSNVTLSITNLFIEHSQYQIIVNTLADFYQVSDDEIRADIINALSNSAKIQKLLLAPEWSSGAIESTNRNTILIDMTLCYINKHDANLSNNVIEKLFKSGCFDSSPEFRDIVFRKLNDVSVILDDSVIEKWNALSENNEEALHNLWNKSPYGKYLSHIAEYISNSQAASDFLKFTTFVEAKNIDSFFSIKDYNFCIAWIAKQSDRFILEFIRQSQHIPYKIVVDAIQKIGHERVANICNTYQFLFFLFGQEDFLSKFFIDLVAIIYIFSEQPRTESRQNEGMKNKECMVNNCSFNVYVQSEYAKSICTNDIDCSILKSMNKYPHSPYWIICITDNAGEKRLAKFSIQYNMSAPHKFCKITSYGEQYVKTVMSLIIKNFVGRYEHFYLRTNYFSFTENYRSKADKCVVYFCEAVIVGWYRGEDSGARCPEYDCRDIRKYDITFVLDNTIKVDDKTISIKDLCYNLARDGAETPPYYRHEILMGYLLSHPELILTE